LFLRVRSLALFFSCCRKPVVLFLSLPLFMTSTLLCSLGRLNGYDGRDILLAPSLGMRAFSRFSSFFGAEPLGTLLSPRLRVHVLRSGGVPSLNLFRRRQRPVNPPLCNFPLQRRGFFLACGVVGRQLPCRQLGF